MNATRTGTVAGAIHAPPRRPSALISAIVWNHRLGRDFVTWTALALVVAAILVVTTRHPIATNGTAATVGRTRPTVAQRLGRSHRTLRSSQTTTAPPERRSDRSSHATPAAGHSIGTTTSSTPTSSSSTTTSTSTTSTSTTSTIATPPLASIDVPGSLAYPADVSTTYPIDVGSGIVRATLVFGGDTRFTLSVRCNRAAGARSSTGGTIVVSRRVAAGRCEFEVGLDSLSGGSDPYHLNLVYPLADTGKSP